MPHPTIAPELANRIACGIAGWSYPDWKGYVYPPGTKDTLRYIAGYVDLIEINSTFYRPPSAHNATSWIERTIDLPDFFFTAKLHQDVTHGGIITSNMVHDFHVGFEPMTRAGRLKHLLAQFRYDFGDTCETRRHLESIENAFGDITQLTLELRHTSWQTPDALRFLESLDVTIANLDYPLAANSFNLRACHVGDHAYLRLHGRNHKAWFNQHAGRDETYDYCYNNAELDDILDRAVELARMSTSVTVVANNHYHGKEAVNALQLKAMIAADRIPVPSPLAKKYPQLVEIRKD